MKNYYKILEIEFGATSEEIKGAYRKCAMKYHPDKNLSNTEYYTIFFSEINEANTVLSDYESKSKYDVKFINYFSKTNGKYQIKKEAFQDSTESEIVEILRSIPFIKNTFEINKEFIRYNKRTVAIRNIIGIKIGFVDTGLFEGSYTYNIYLKSNEGILQIPISNILVPDSYQKRKFDELTLLINHYIISHLLKDIIKRLDDGENFIFGNEIEIRREGIMFLKKKTFVAWINTKCTNSKYNGWFYRTNAILVENLNGKKIKGKVYPLHNWNAYLFKYIHNYYTYT